MKIIKSKKGFVLLLATLVVAGAAAFGAYAYWTTTGSGSATAAAGSADPAALTLTGTFASGIHPGGSESVSFTAANTSETDLLVNNVVFGDVTSSDPDCTAALALAAPQFSMDTVAENKVVPGGATATALPNDGTLVWANTATDQNPCQGASLTLSVTTN